VISGYHSGMAVNAYRWRQRCRLRELDPRLEWRPVDEIRVVLRCISRRRPLRLKEARRIVRAMARRLCWGPPGTWTVERAILDYWGPLDFMWRSRMVRVQSVCWEELEREARSERRQFCLVVQHWREVEMRLWRREEELNEVRRLVNKIRKAVTDERKRFGQGGNHPSHREGDEKRAVADPAGVV